MNAVFGGAPGGAAEPRGRSGQGFGYGPELLDEMTTTQVHLASRVAGSQQGNPVACLQGRAARVALCGRHLPRRLPARSANDFP